VYDLSCYMMDNASEYWAEGTQAWFDATVREGEDMYAALPAKRVGHPQMACLCLLKPPYPNSCSQGCVGTQPITPNGCACCCAGADVTSGVNTRDKLRERDPALAEIMTLVYGDGEWRHPRTAPRPFAPYQKSAKQRQRPTRDGKKRARSGGEGQQGSGAAEAAAQDAVLQVVVVPDAEAEMSNTLLSGAAAAGVAGGEGGTTRRGRRRAGSPAGRHSGRAASSGGSKGKLTSVPRRFTRALARLAGCCLPGPASVL
jgi:hypothetical protein